MLVFVDLSALGQNHELQLDHRGDEKVQKGERRKNSLVLAGWAPETRFCRPKYNLGASEVISCLPVQSVHSTAKRLVYEKSHGNRLTGSSA